MSNQDFTFENGWHIQNQIVIAVDSVADIPEEWLAKWNIKVISLEMKFYNQVRQASEVTVDDVFNYYHRSGVLPETSPPNRDTFFKLFNYIHFNNAQMVYIATTSTISETYHEAIASVEAHGFSDRIFVVDSYFASVGVMPLLKRAAEMREQGKTANEIVFALNRMKQSACQTYFMVDDTAYLMENQNVSKVAEMFAGVFNIKPSLHFVDGHIVPAKKFNGSMKRILPKFVKFAFADKKIDDSCLIIGHSGASPVLLQQTEQYAKSYAPFQEVLLQPAGSIISAHLGKGAIILTFLLNE